MFSTDHSWLLSTLWDDSWTCIGGSTQLINALAASHPDGFRYLASNKERVAVTGIDKQAGGLVLVPSVGLSQGARCR